MTDAGPDRGTTERRARSSYSLLLVCAVYLILSVAFGCASLDVDERGFAKEPYQLIGGDYTRGYLAEGELGSAASTVLKSYLFYWKYRPLFAPIIEEGDRNLFAAEELRFGYEASHSRDGLEKSAAVGQSERLVVPEPDRFYRHGAGKPLLPAILSIPQTLLVGLISVERPGFLNLQDTHNYHPIFVLTRLAQILSGLASILLVWWILAWEYDATRALLGASLVAFFPLSIVWFPNLHHDAILVPFVLLTAYFFLRRQYTRAGVFFGLALASKNVAIFLAVALLAYVIWDTLSARRHDPHGAVRAILRGGMKGWARAMLVGGLVLLPFANPLSYLDEVATPLTHRAYDKRGENVDRFTVAGKLRAPERQGKNADRSVLRREVRAINSAVGFQEMWFLFVALAGLCSSLARIRRLHECAS